MLLWRGGGEMERLHGRYSPLAAGMSRQELAPTQEKPPPCGEGFPIQLI